MIQLQSCTSIAEEVHVGHIFTSGTLDGASMRTRQRLHGCRRVDHRVGHHRPVLSLLRHLAAHHQYNHNSRYFPCGFLLQNTQNRDTAAIQLKLDELARNMMLCLEDLSEDELRKVKATFESLAAAPAAAGHILARPEELRDAGDALQDAAAKLHQTMQEPTGRQ
jgi:hypothetical protein